MEGDNHEEPIQVVMFPSLGFGHIFPFVHLSNTLVAHGVNVTFLTLPSLVPRICPSLDPKIPILNYKLASVDGLPPDIECSNGSSQVVIDLLTRALDGTRPQIAKILAELSPQVVIFDSLHDWVPQVAELLGIKSIYFSVFNAITVASTALFGLTPHQRPSVRRLRLPPRRLLSMYLSVRPYEIRGMLYNNNDSSKAPSNFSRLVSCMARCDAVAVRSMYEIEAASIEYLSSQCRKPVVPTGMFQPNAPAGDLDPKLAGWLNKFPKATVVYCTLGSESYLSVKQMRELVAGLDMIGFPFLAVLNVPADAPKAQKNEFEAEICGEKAGGIGMVRSGWVNQQLILRHPAVGCSINHSGLITVMEAVWGGCQLVLLPLKGDQFLITRLMVKGFGSAVKINRRVWDGWFTRKAVRKAVKTVMAEGSRKGMVVRANNAKLREIILQGGLQENYIKHMIIKLKELVASP